MIDSPVFEVLFDESGDGDLTPAALRDVYGAGLVPAAQPDRASVAVNFVVSRDGRISFSEPGFSGGGDVAGSCPADRWLMGALRSQCDAVLIGDGTVRVEPDHVWVAEHIAPEWTESLRAARGDRPPPTLVVLSMNGVVHDEWATLRRHDIPLIVATRSACVDSAQQALAGRPNAEVWGFGDDTVDVAALLRWLHAERAIGFVLCEGGPQVYASLLAAQCVDEEFLTLSPTIIGSSTAGGARRPSLVEGVGFLPGCTPTLRPISLRRAGDHLFLRSVVDYSTTN